jgi:hypothetical protein
MAPTADDIRQHVHSLADYMDSRSRQADVSADVTLDKIYRELHSIIGELAELTEDAQVMPTLYGARLVDNPAEHDGTLRYVVEVYDLGSYEVIGTSIPINYTLHVRPALAQLNVDGHAFRIVGRPFRTRTGPGVWSTHWPVRTVAAPAEQPSVPAN